MAWSTTWNNVTVHVFPRSWLEGLSKDPRNVAEPRGDNVTL